MCLENGNCLLNDVCDMLFDAILCFSVLPRFIQSANSKKLQLKSDVTDNDLRGEIH